MSAAAGYPSGSSSSLLLLFHDSKQTKTALKCQLLLIHLFFVPFSLKPKPPTASGKSNQPISPPPPPMAIPETISTKKAESLSHIIGASCLWPQSRISLP